METTITNIVNTIRAANDALDSHVANWTKANPDTPIHRDYEAYNTMKSLINLIDHAERVLHKIKK